VLSSDRTCECPAKCPERSACAARPKLQDVAGYLQDVVGYLRDVAGYLRDLKSWDLGY
jgi:hypothetical protein